MEISPQVWQHKYALILGRFAEIQAVFCTSSALSSLCRSHVERVFGEMMFERRLSQRATCLCPHHRRATEGLTGCSAVSVAEVTLAVCCEERGQMSDFS